MSPARRLNLLTLSHVILGTLFAAVWGIQAVVFGLAFPEFLHSNAVAKIGFTSSIAYAALGVLWLVVGLLLHRGASPGTIRALSVLALFFLPFGPILSVPALFYVKQGA